MLTVGRSLAINIALFLSRYTLSSLMVRNIDYYLCALPICFILFRSLINDWSFNWRIFFLYYMGDIIRLVILPHKFVFIKHKTIVSAISLILFISLCIFIKLPCLTQLQSRQCKLVCSDGSIKILSAVFNTVSIITPILKMICFNHLGNVLSLDSRDQLVISYKVLEYLCLISIIIFMLTGYSLYLISCRLCREINIFDILHDQHQFDILYVLAKYYNEILYMIFGICSLINIS